MSERLYSQLNICQYKSNSTFQKLMKTNILFNFMMIKIEIGVFNLSQFYFVYHQI